MTQQLVAPPVRCQRLHCGGVIIVSETGTCCLLCGRPPAGSTPEPLPLTAARPLQPRSRESDGEIRERLLSLLDYGPRPRPALRLEGVAASRISAVLAEMRREGELMSSPHSKAGPSVWSVAPELKAPQAGQETASTASDGGSGGQHGCGGAARSRAAEAAAARLRRIREVSG